MKVTNVNVVTRDDDVCSICIEPFSVGGTLELFTECGHVFHTACVASWVRQDRQSRCPLCRQLIVASDLDDIVKPVPSSPAHSLRVIFLLSTSLHLAAAVASELATQAASSAGIEAPLDFFVGNAVLFTIAALDLPDEFIFSMQSATREADRFTRTVLRYMLLVLVYTTAFNTANADAVSLFSKFVSEKLPDGVSSTNLTTLRGAARDHVRDNPAYLVEKTDPHAKYATTLMNTIWEAIDDVESDTINAPTVLQKLQGALVGANAYLQKHDASHSLPPSTKWWLADTEFRVTLRPNVHLARLVYQCNKNVHPELGPMSRWNTSLVTDMGSAFWRYKGPPLDLSKWDTSSVTNMDGMFAETTAEVRGLSEFDVSSVTSMKRMFYLSDLRAVASDAESQFIDLDTWDTSSVRNTKEMFLLSKSRIVGQQFWTLQEGATKTNMYDRFKPSYPDGDLDADGIPRGLPTPTPTPPVPVPGGAQRNMLTPGNLPGVPTLGAGQGPHARRAGKHFTPAVGACDASPPPGLSSHGPRTRRQSKPSPAPGFSLERRPPR